MYKDGHIGFNALLYAPFVPLVSARWSLETAVLGTVLVVGLAPLPDIDQLLPQIAHRGPTHTVWFAVLVGLFVGVGTTLLVDATPTATASAFPFGFALGTGSVLAHLAGDIVTPMGISPFSPVSAAHVTLDLFPSKHGRINRAVLLLGSSALLVSLVLTISFSSAGAPPI
ncbi:metal-dependent hydrolase [Halopiger aswanensis]|uniref:Inner membrane protein n=1 Tax=Halopiger aswanensis TaxID=148449 RepID=A0A3R7KKW8_9EURY|nr:metal-dependent hydrolase [Halopiger aswanensis]RKD95128.1 inner membrane protein [Halopiger aswanensis]